MKKIIFSIVAATAIVVASSGVASAHVTVKPAEAEAAAFQTFNTSVPNEKEVPTIGVRLVIPAGLKHVTPTVKPGWTIETVKEGEGESATIKEITWSGGSVPAGQRDDFGFSAQLPAEPVTLQWKAYQTYEGGEVVAWDQAPSGDGHDGSKPYSETKVVAEASTSAASGADSGSDGRTTLAIVLSVVAVVLSAVALTKRK